jgi:hypothetical protein
MNDLQICHENDAIINLKVGSCNAALDFLGTDLKKGQRDFYTKLGKLSIEAQKIQAKENEIQQKYAVSAMKEENKYRLASLNVRNAEIKAQNKLDLAKIQAVADYKLAQLKSSTQIQRDEISANKDIELAKTRAEERILTKVIDATKEIRMAEEKTEQLRIKEQSKILEQLANNALDAFNRKFDFYESQLQLCKDFFMPQIESLNQYIETLQEQYNSNFKNQEAHIYVFNQIDKLEKTRNDLNQKVVDIISKLTTEARLEKLDYNSSVSKNFISGGIYE